MQAATGEILISYFRLISFSRCHLHLRSLLFTYMTTLMAFPTSWGSTSCGSIPAQPRRSLPARGFIGPSSSPRVKDHDQMGQFGKTRPVQFQGPIEDRSMRLWQHALCRSRGRVSLWQDDDNASTREYLDRYLPESLIPRHKGQMQGLPKRQTDAKSATHTRDALLT